MMIESLELLLRIGGVGLILLALVHVPVSRHLRWREDATRLTPTNASIFLVHAFFICVVLVLMGLPALLAPQVFLERSPAGAWLSWSLAVFWGIRLFVQWFVYPSALWRGKRFETRMHILFSVVWTLLTAVFVACGLVQSNLLH